MEDNKFYEERCGGIPEKTEIDKLIELLETSRTKIPYEVGENHGRPQVFYPSKEDCVSDAICNYLSYGHEEGKIEIMGLTMNDDIAEGWLSSWEVYCRWLDHWKYVMKEKLDD